MVLCHHCIFYIITHCSLSSVSSAHHYPLFAVITIHFTSLPIVLCHHYLQHITTHCSLSLSPIVNYPLLFIITNHCSLSSVSMCICSTIHSLFYITTHCLYHIFVMTIHCYLSPHHIIPFYIMTHCPISSLPTVLSSLTIVLCNNYSLFSIISSHCSKPSLPLPTVHHYPLFCHHDPYNNGLYNYMDYVMTWNM